MQTLTRIFILLLLLCGVAHALSPAQEGNSPLVQVSPEDDTITVLMPARPASATGSYRIGAINAKGSVYFLTHRDVTYRVWSLRDEARASSSVPDEDAYLDACADLVWDSLLKADRDKVEKSKSRFSSMRYGREMLLGTLLGREYLITLGTTPGVVHFYTAKQRIYVLVMTWPPGNLSPEDPFLGSFKLKDAVHAATGEGPMLFPPSDRPIPYGDPVQRARENDAAGVGAGTGGGGDTARPPSTPALDEDNNRIYSPREITQKARILLRPEPRYTESARKYQVSGTVVLRAVFSARGEVTNIRVVRKLPHGLTELSVAAARALKFVPAMKDGKPVSQYIQIEYNYNLY